MTSSLHIIRSFNKLKSGFDILSQSFNHWSPVGAKVGKLEFATKFKYSDRLSKERQSSEIRVQEFGKNGQDSENDAAHNPIALPLDAPKQHTSRNSKDNHLTKKKYKHQNSFNVSNQLNQNMLFGIHPVLLALKANRRKNKRVFLKRQVGNLSERLQELVSLADQANIPIERVSVAHLNELTGGRPHQGICLDTSPLPVPFADELMSNPTNSCNGCYPLWLFVNEIHDPMNLGAILRSAYYLGIDKVFGPKDGNCSLSPIVCKASSGAMEVIPYYYVENVEQFLDRMIQINWEVVGTVSLNELTSPKTVKVEDFCITKPTILVVGNEGMGLNNDICQLCQTHLTISCGNQPSERITSLNVSVATAIVLHSLMQKNRKIQNSGV